MREQHKMHRHNFLGNARLRALLLMPLSVIAFLAVWHLAALAANSALILPPPAAVLRWIAHNGTRAEFLHHIGASCARAGTAIALTIALGSALGICAGLSPSFRALIAFPLTVIRAAPVVSLILLAVFWLGTNALPVFVAALMALPVMIDSVSGGVQKIPARLRDAMRVYGFSRLMLLRHVYVPGAFPAFLSGARSVFGLCWKVVAAGEVLALPRHGAGQLLYSAKVHLETTEVFAVTVILIVICFALEGAFSLLIKIKRDGGSPPRVSAAAGAASFTAPPAGTPRNAPSSPAVQSRVLSVQNLCVTRGHKEIYRSFSARFEEGKVTALIAASGRGKTTLLDCIAGILRPQSGSISFGSDTAFRVSYLFQDDQLLPWRTIEQNVALPLRGPDALQKARGFLEKTGLAARQTALPRELSGGERQRAALARAFCFAAPVLLMDEAFQSLDLPLKLNLMSLTHTLLAEESRAAIFVTHDVREALCLADRILVLAGEPLTVTRDITVPRAKTPAPGSPRGVVADRYVHLPPELLALEEDILDALSRDHAAARA